MRFDIELAPYLSKASLLSVFSIFLLLFITISVLYLSVVDWRDKRRLKKFNEELNSSQRKDS
tara:strand:+ start:297 stop:482 length:186 start_codon:yes stop_codon:yes gene_type:complete